ncbi:MAG: NAD(P)/FAD-dependent oxidoreductase [Endomicrobiaceae bacterium]|jgi:predicted Rossmann fold flavoprotein|nr:NAD(P)/FAD-dependent oxidoreductase [Endomicrobiaceae bacterium]
MNKTDVIVIGAGASGLMAAGKAAEYGLDVLLLEKKSRPGIKLSITGKGRCNITNSAELKDFVSEFGDNGKFLFGAFSKFFNNDLIDFFKKLGVDSRLERGGRYFPESDDAHQIVNALIKYAKQNNVKIRTASPVEKIVRENNKIKEIILSGGEVLQADNYILAAGGKSYPLTGSSGDGYMFAKSLGHTISDPSPALVPLVLNTPYLKQLNGLKLKNIELTLYADDKKVNKLFGEIEFTIFGLTGPLILTISAQVYKFIKQNKKVAVSVNFKPALEEKQLDERLVRELNNFGGLPVRNMLKTLLPLQMVEVFMKENNIKHTEKCSSVNKEARKKILQGLTDMKFNVVSTRPIDEAIITSGGICLDEVEQNTMKSKIIDNLYFCGEILDIDGPTGGFNLQAAFSTGYLAGTSIGENK